VCKSLGPEVLLEESMDGGEGSLRRYHCFVHGDSVVYHDLLFDHVVLERITN